MPRVDLGHDWLAHPDRRSVRAGLDFYASHQVVDQGETSTVFVVAIVDDLAVPIAGVHDLDDQRLSVDSNAQTQVGTRIGVTDRVRGGFMSSQHSP